METEEKKKSGKVWITIMVICLFIAGIGGGIYYRNYLVQKRAEEELEKLQQQTNEETEKPEKKPLTYEEKCRLLKEKYGVDVPEKNIDFAKLQAEVNADIYAWIYIPGTNVDYPVVQHPTDVNYYLDYNLDGTQGLPGCIYSENYNTKDFDDRNTVIYGHNMNDGSMFASLFNYRDRSFMDGNPYVFIYKEKDVFVYRVFGASVTDDSHQLLTNNISTDALFMKYLNDIVGSRDMRNNIDTTVELTPKSKIVTLSTCVNEVPEERYIVQGVLLEVE